jgi:hypothetical protein
VDTLFAERIKHREEEWGRGGESGGKVAFSPSNNGGVSRDTLYTQYFYSLILRRVWLGAALCNR